MLKIWVETQNEFASGLKNGRYVVAENAGHFIYRDQPDLVVNEIKAAVERARAR
jgi:pimeloyl-ACP methyl ester carboxylesterase